jgi:hypothetical protein
MTRCASESSPSARHRRLHRHHAGHLQGREPAADGQGSGPNAVTVLGGIHGTFMYPQVLKEAPWIDAVVRGEGEQVFLNLVRAVDDGSWAATAQVRGIAYPRRPGRWQGGGHPGRAADRGPGPHHARLGHPGVGQVHLHPDGHPRGDPQLSRAAAPSPAASAASGSSGATTASATRRRWSTRSSRWCATTRWASSSWPTKSRPSTARSSSPSARN